MELTEYEQLRAALADAPNVAVALGAHPGGSPTGAWAKPSWLRFCELARTTRFIGEIGLDFAGPRDTEESRALQTSAFACILATCNESAAPLGTHQSRRRDSNQRAKPNLYRNHEPRGEPTQRRHPHPQRHRHCAEAHLHPRHQCRRSSTRCARTSQHLCAASRDLHWFSGTSDDLHRAVKLGCLFSVGPRMLASRRGREYARQIPLGQLLLETDMPARKDDNLPAEVWRAELNNALSGIAQLKGIDRAELAEHIASTSRELLIR
ncbi:MAG: TatD family hydrolase [Adlercreutzia equolifaciens]